jgi:hypothetical protein
MAQSFADLIVFQTGEKFCLCETMWFPFSASHIAGPALPCADYRAIFINFDTASAKARSRRSSSPKLAP